MLAFHAKLAWNFLNNDTLWAGFARRRFRIGEKGSGLWNKFHHLISHLQANSTWKIGNGDTYVSEFCLRIGLEAPALCANLSVKDCMSNSEQSSALLAILPEELCVSLRNAQWSAANDRFVWRGSTDGVFSVKKFWQTYQTLFPKLDWCKHIWVKWIPPKIVCFIWKLMHNIVATDDNVSRLNIPLASRCVCCTKPTQETARHLFFEGDWGKALWSFLNATFALPKVHGTKAMSRIWFRNHVGSFMERFSTSIVFCGLWEIWCARNKMIQEGSLVDWKRKLMVWGPNIAFLLKDTYVDPSFQNRNILSIFKIPLRNVIAKKMLWRAWQPSIKGLTMNIATLTVDGIDKGGGIIRDAQGNFIFAFLIIRPAGDQFMFLMDCIAHGLGISSANGWSVAEVQSSHVLMNFMDRGVDDLSIDHEANRRICYERFPLVSFNRIWPILNSAAIALVCLSREGVFPSVSLLPLPVRRALVLCSCDSFYYEAERDDILISVDNRVTRDDAAVNYQFLS